MPTKMARPSGPTGRCPERLAELSCPQETEFMPAAAMQSLDHFRISSEVFHMHSKTKITSYSGIRLVLVLVLTEWPDGLAVHSIRLEDLTSEEMGAKQNSFHALRMADASSYFL